MIIYLTFFIDKIFIADDSLIERKDRRSSIISGTYL